MYSRHVHDGGDETSEPGPDSDSTVPAGAGSSCGTSPIRMSGASSLPATRYGDGGVPTAMLGQTAASKRGVY